jgi:hypothetical protein
MGFFPAKALEDMLGIEGISVNWKMPEGEDIDSIEEKVSLKKGILGGAAETLFWLIHDKRDSYASNSVTYKLIDFTIGGEEKRRAKLYNAVWNSLTKENPALGQVNVDRNNSRSLWDAIRGCISQFNADDINYFLHHSIEERNTAEYKTLEAVLTEKGVRWQWIASPETMQKILQSLEKKENAQAIQEKQPSLMPSHQWQKRTGLRQQQTEAEKMPTH